MTERWTVKIADFGTAKLMQYMAPKAGAKPAGWRPWGSAPGSTSSSGESTDDRQLAEQTTYVGTLLWEAPEVLRGDTNYYSSVDVYSYGARGWEFFQIAEASNERCWQALCCGS